MLSIYNESESEQASNEDNDKVESRPILTQLPVNKSHQQGNKHAQLDTAFRESNLSQNTNPNHESQSLLQSNFIGQFNNKTITNKNIPMKNSSNIVAGNVVNLNQDNSNRTPSYHSAFPMHTNSTVAHFSHPAHAPVPYPITINFSNKNIPYQPQHFPQQNIMNHHQYIRPQNPYVIPYYPPQQNPNINSRNYVSYSPIQENPKDARLILPKVQQSSNLSSSNLHDQIKENDPRSVSPSELSNHKFNIHNLKNTQKNSNFEGNITVKSNLTMQGRQLERGSSATETHPLHSYSHQEASYVQKYTRSHIVQSHSQGQDNTETAPKVKQTITQVQTASKVDKEVLERMKYFNSLYGETEVDPDIIADMIKYL